MRSQSLINFLSLQLVQVGLTVTFSTLSHADIFHAYGPLTVFGEHLKTLGSSTLSTSGKHPNFLYLNANNALSKDQQLTIEQQLLSGQTLVIDGTESSPKTQRSISALLGGIGLHGDVIMIHKPRGAQPQYTQLTATKSGNKKEDNFRVSHKLASETLAIQQHWGKHTVHPVKKRTTTNDAWQPETTINIELRQINMPCLVGNQMESRASSSTYWTGGLIDACNQNASYSLNYVVDFIRSVASAEHSAQDDKYIRFTVNPESNGGSGWHLVNQPTHRHTWFESWTHRTTWFGPIADSYTMEIKTHDPEVSLYHAIPTNTPRHSKIKAKTTIKVNMAARFGIEPGRMQGANNLGPPAPPGDDANIPLADGIGADGAGLQNLPEAGIPQEHAPAYEPPPPPDQQQPQQDSHLPAQPSLALETIEEEAQATNKPATTQEEPLALPALHLNIFEESDNSDENRMLQTQTSNPKREKAIDKGYKTISLMPVGAYFSSKSLVYSNHEYEIASLLRNRPNATASWHWHRGFSKYSKEWRTHGRCELFCQDWFFNDNKFSGLAYAHFVPGFSATFKVSGNKTNRSTFEVSASVLPVALGGHIRYFGLFQDYSQWDQKGHLQTISQQMTIDWGATAFNASPAISLEAANINSDSGLCLNVIENNHHDGARVGIHRCHHRRNQLWLYDKHFRLQSLNAPDRCLTGEADETVRLRNCSHVPEQKWQFHGNQLRNLQGDYLETTPEGELKNTHLHHIDTQWRPYIHETSPDNAVSLTK